MGKKESKLGIRASQTAEVILEDCRVPMEYLLGGYEKLEKKLARARSGESTGRSSGALATFELTRPLVGASALGIAQAAYEWTLEYLEGKEEDGTPLLEQQRVQQVLAEVATEIEAARLLVWRASWMGRNGVPMTGGQGSMSKLKAGDVAMWATTTLMDLVGPFAQTTDCPLEKFFRDAKIYQLFEGTAQVQRLVISRMQRSDYRGRLEVEDVVEQAPGSSARRRGPLGGGVAVDRLSERTLTRKRADRGARGASAAARAPARSSRPRRSALLTPLQGQDSPAPYVALAARLDGFAPRAAARRRSTRGGVVKTTIMRADAAPGRPAPTTPPTHQLTRQTRMRKWRKDLRAPRRGARSWPSWAPGCASRARTTRSASA